MKIALFDTGIKLYRLTILREVEKRGYQRYFECRCECGNICIVRGSAMRAGKAKSCGCLRKELKPVWSKKINPVKRHPLYKTWQGMKARCYNSNNQDYKDYGGRGIFVCDSWRNSFIAFINDMGARPIGMTLDRENNNGNYEPTNCRWATQKEQIANSRPKRKKTSTV